MFIKNAYRAFRHNVFILNHHHEDIKRSIKKSKIIEGFDDIEYVETPEPVETIITVCNTTAEQTVPFYNGSDVTVLNFAHFTNPGGGYMKGAMAQEESLCHNSTLYPVLKAHTGFYKTNKMFENDGLYYDTALFTPAIRFGQVYCNVLTCAAPNYKEWCAAPRNKTVPSYVIQEDNTVALKQRIDFVLGCLRYLDQKTIVLGAWGCGVFEQRAIIVASIFHELLETKYSGVFERVIFAVPDSTSANYNAFRYIFEKQGVYEKKSTLKKYEVPFIDPSKDEMEIFHIKAVDKYDALKATQLLIESRGVYCDDNILDYIIEVDEKSYLTVEDIIKMTT